MKVTLSFSRALQVTWRKLPNRNPLTIGTNTWVKDKRIHAEHVPNSSQWNLVIEKVNSTDAGTYECQVSARGKQFRQQVVLEVKGTSMIIIIVILKISGTCVCVCVCGSFFAVVLGIVVVVVSVCVCVCNPVSLTEYRGVKCV